MAHPAPDLSDAAQGPQRAELGSVALLFVIATAAYVLLGRRLPVPMIAPDEYLYGNLAQSIAHGDGLSYRGEPQALRAALYVIAIAPSWIVASTVGGYAVAKALSAALVCSVVFPTWWLARQLVPPRLAVTTAALVVAGASMVVAGEIVTENLAYPLSTAALVAMVMVLRQPGSRWQIVAVVCAVLAAASRAQLVVLLAVLPLAVIADGARHGHDWRARLAAHRGILIGSGLILISGSLFALLARNTALGTYGSITLTPPLLRTLTATGHQLVGLLTSAGILPLLVVAAASSRRASWRDPSLGPLLAVLWPVTLLVVLESAWALAGFNSDWHIERYVVYPLPLLLIAAVAAIDRRLVGLRAMTVATVIAALALLLAPEVREAQEELSTYGLFRAGHALLGASTPVSLALWVIVAGGSLAAILAARRGLASPRHALAFAALTVVVFAVQDQAAWRWKADIASSWRALYPHNLAWVDDDARKPLARLVGAANASVIDVSQFFNRTIGPTYVPEQALGGTAVRSPHCTWHVGADGTLTFDAGCGPAPSRFYLDDNYAKFTFREQQLELSHPPVARIVSIPPPGIPRLRALFFPACSPPLPTFGADGHGPTVGPPRRVCDAPSLGARFWLERPATLVMRWRGGAAAAQATIGQQLYDFPAGVVKTIRLPIPASPVSFGMQLGWRGRPPEVPELLSAILRDGRSTTNLLY